MELRLLRQGTFSCTHLTWRSEVCNNTFRQFNDFAFVALLAQVKPQNSTVRAAIRWVRSFGRVSFRGFLQGFCGPHLESGRRLRPFFLLRTNPRGIGKECTVWRQT